MKFKPPATLLIIGVAFFIVIANNQTLFSLLHTRFGSWNGQNIAYVVALYSLLIALISLPLLLAAYRFWLKPALILLILLSATLSYFTDQLGIVFDIDMIRNSAETLYDQNTQEAAELLSVPLIGHFFLWGIIPSIIVGFIPIKPSHFWQSIKQRGLALVIMFFIPIALIFSNFQFASFFHARIIDLFHKSKIKQLAIVETDD